MVTHNLEIMDLDDAILRWKKSSCPTFPLQPSKILGIRRQNYGESLESGKMCGKKASVPRTSKYYVMCPVVFFFFLPSETSFLEFV